MLLSFSPMACMKFFSIIPQKRNRHLIIFLLAFAFLFMSTLNPSQIMAQGRQFPDANMRKDQENAVKMRVLIGSRPPRCDQRCKRCGHCEAVQVPIAPTIKFLHQEIPTIAYSRGDDISNYKPMCWKCKCGDFIFNP